MTRDEKIAEARRLRDSGLTYAKIAKILRCSDASVHGWLNPKVAEEHREWNRERSREYYANNREKMKEQHAEYRSTMHGRCLRALARSRINARKYGHLPCDATVEELEAAFTGKCHICGKPEEDLTKRLAMDHVHTERGEFRGWLCDNCNKTLGHFNDDPELLQRGIDFLNGDLNPNIMMPPFREAKTPKNIKTNRHTIMKHRLKEALRNSKRDAKRGHTACTTDVFTIMEGWRGCCYICRAREEHLKQRLVVDHHHTSGKFRAFLCSHCNLGLGLANDDPVILQRMIDYLKGH